MSSVSNGMAEVDHMSARAQSVTRGSGGPREKNHVKGRSYAVNYQSRKIMRSGPILAVLVHSF